MIPIIEKIKSKRVAEKPVIMWIVIAVLLFSVGVMLRWQHFEGVDSYTINQLTKSLQKQSVIDSMNMVSLNFAIDDLKMQNDLLKKEIILNRSTIETIKTLSIKKQYEMYLLGASDTRDYFMQRTGGGHAELIDRSGDTLMITPIENIKDANIKLVELEYVIKERDEYIGLTNNLTSEINNLDGIIFYKDSIISIQENQIILNKDLVTALEKEQVKKDKKIKNGKIKTWIIAGSAAAGIVLLSVLN